MNKLKLWLIIPGLIVIGAIVAGCSQDSAAGDSTGSPAKVDTRGNVSVAVQWQKAADGSFVFDISMNTHSVDLDGYDLAELAVLRDDAGAEYFPIA